MKHAILNIADTGASDSTAYMLESVGYRVSRPGPALLEQIRAVAACPIHSVDELVERWGYAQPLTTALATPEDMLTCDLFVDVKAHVNYAPFVERWPHLEGKIMWCCLNGGDPLKRTDGLPWANPPCPVLTNNQWYRILTGRGVADWAYVCYPPYRRIADRNRTGDSWPPMCLVHNVRRWGYGHLVDPIRALGVKFYGGAEDDPDGLLPHAKAMELLADAKCVVHLKCGDTVGYAMVEAMVSGVPFVCTARYVEECRLREALVHGETCLILDDGDEVEHLRAILSECQQKEWDVIAKDGRNRYLSIQWDAKRDGPWFAEWLRRNYEA